MKPKYKLNKLRFYPIWAVLSLLGLCFITIGLTSTFNKDLQAFLVDVQTDNQQSFSGFHVAPPINEFITASILNFDKDYDVTPAPQASGTVRIPVLTYHHLAPVPNKAGVRDYYVSPEVFEEQLKYLDEKNYKVLTPKEFYDLLMTGKNPIQKSVMLTFDDGNYDNYQYAFPLLKKYGFTAVFYVPSDRSGISRAKLREMTDAGMVIDPHGRTHMLLGKVDDADSLYSEITVSKRNIEYMTGKTAVSFCYPGCEYNGAVIGTLRSSNYLLAFTCGRSIDHRPGNRFVLNRMHVYDDMNHFKSILSGVSYYPY